MPRRYHILTDDKLLALSEEGDGFAAGVLDDRHIVRDMATNPHTRFSDHLVRLGANRWLLFRLDNTPYGRRVTVWHDVSEGGSRAIEMCAEELRTWRRLLQEWQQDSDPRRRYLSRLSRLHRQGFSYAALAHYIAREGVDWLRWYLKQCSEARAAVARRGIWTAEEEAHWKEECSAALSGFRFAGCKDEALLTEWLKRTLQAMASGSGAVNVSISPLDPATVREKLRYLGGA